MFLTTIMQQTKLKLSFNIKKNYKVILFFILAFVLTLFFLKTSKQFKIEDTYDYSCAVFDQNQDLIQITLTKDEKYRLQANLDQISEKFVETTLLYEDKYYFYHFGVNPISLIRSFFSYVFKNKTQGGASTITMQVVRLVHRLNTKSLRGKVKQIVFAIWYEFLFSKSEILSLYFSVAPYGSNIEGIEAASLIYYGKRAKNLDYNEAVRLAILPQNPSKRWREKLGNDHFLATKNIISQLKNKYPDQEITPKALIRTPKSVPNFAKHFVDRLKQFDKKPFINSTLNLGIQKKIEEIAAAYIKMYRELNIENVSVLVTEGKEMNVRAYLGSASYLDHSIQGFVNGLSSKRSPGSLLKPLIYGLAIEQGLITDQTTLYDLPIKIASYHPENFERNYLGPLSATDALVKSRNIPALELFRKLKKDSFYNLLIKSHVSDLKSSDYYGLGIVLGGIGVSAEEIAQIYGILAHDGEFRENRFFDSQKIDSDKLLSSESARLVSSMLAKNPPALYNYKNMSIPWKTGTSYGSRDAWAAGYFDNYIVVVWLGNFNNKPNSNLVGRDIAGPIFFSLVDSLKNNFYKVKDISTKELNLKKVEVCALSGMIPNESCPHRKESFFIPGVSPIKKCVNHKKILVNTSNNKRACKPCSTCEERVYEIWDSQTYDLFSRAGIRRSAPPNFEDSCQINNATHKAGIRIISPEPHLEYVIEDHRKLELELIASVSTQAKLVYWFIDSDLVSQSEPNQTQYWIAKPGKFVIRAVDDLGNSASIKVVIKQLGTSG